MRLGGPARYVIEVETPEDIPDAYGFAEQYHLPTFALGYGANTLGHDEGYNGVIIINRIRGIDIISPSEQVATTEDGSQQSQPHILKVMGGEYWDDVVQFACERNLTGIEALSKIPGLACAAPVQNIGAYGQEISDTLTEIEVYDTATNEFKTLSHQDLQFSYRKSILNSTMQGRYFVISITLSLSEGQMSQPFYNSIERYISDRDLTDFSPQGIREIVSAIRQHKLPDPLEVASSGSFFHNIYLDRTESERAIDKGYPVHHGKDGHKINAGWLIEQAGLKGKLLHGMRVSDKAPLVLINESATSYNDLAKARSEIISKVYDKFGYWLQQEPVEIQ